MYQNPDPSVPWEVLGPFLANAKQEIEDALSTIPNAKVPCIEIRLFPKNGLEAPVTEYNLLFGEIGRRLVPDDQIVDDDVQQVFRPAQNETFWNWLIKILKMVWLWILRLFGRKASREADSPKLLDLSPAEEIADTKLLEKRNVLASNPELSQFAVGMRALVEASPASCCGYCCEFRIYPLDKVGWWLRQYYRKLDGSCGKRWTSTRCSP
jgi:hypothetical protein